MSAPALPPAAVALLACPVCGQPLAVDAAGLACPAGHSYDRARQGHVTLLPPGGSPHAGDSAAMVADRADFLAAGRYAGITAALADAVLADGVPGTVLDVSRYAARRAARAHPRAMAVVADTWARWPVRDAVVDRVLVVFAPRNGAETARVLRPDGRLVVVTPAADHLAGLVEELGLLHVDPDKADRLSAALEPWVHPVRRSAHREVLTLDHAAVRTLVGMGPHARHLAGEELADRVARLPPQVQVPVSVEVSTWAPAGDTTRARPDGRALGA